VVILALSEGFRSRIARLVQLGIDRRRHHDPVGLKERVEQVRLEKQDR
jgi:hypothetical protein